MKKILSTLLSVTTSAFIFTGIATGSIASAQEPEPVEILSMRSEYEKHFDNGDGTITAFIDTVPLHYESNGEWLEIDNTLVLDESGNYVNKSNSMDVMLASTASVSDLDTVDNEPLASIDYNGYSISWDFVSEQPETAIDASIGDILTPISYASVEKSAERVEIDLGSGKLNQKAEESVSKLSSSVSYDSLYKNMDVDIDVMPSSVKETMILNERDNVPEQFSYYIKAEGLTAELYEDNSVHFLNEADEDIFNIPAPYMFDSADIPENNYDIKVDVQEYEKGYLLTFIPDNDWIQNSERVYPAMINVDIQTKVAYAGIDYSYISEQAPSSLDSNNYLRVGNQDKAGCQSFIKINNLFSNISFTISNIYSANFCLYVPPNSLKSDFYVDVYSVDAEQSDVCWNNSSSFENNTRISRFAITESAEYKQYAMNITDLVQYWLNNYNTGLSNVGIPNYGFKLATDSKTTMYLCCDPSSKYRPYFAMMYSLEPSFRTEYNPDKYNNFGKITNFQDRMNCYAYALQMYYKGPLEKGAYYKLQPGEIGLNQKNSSYQYSVTTFKQLMDGYTSFENINDFSNYTDEQMRKDAAEMNFDINRLSMNNSFILPLDFDENNQRIIAMIAGYKMYTSGFEMHYLLRNGNGTCTKKGHSSTCSIWSHKPGNLSITTEAWGSKLSSDTLCDENIISDTKTLWQFPYYGVTYNSNPWFYTITKSTDLYSSWHTYGHDDNSTGTPYYYGG